MKRISILLSAIALVAIIFAGCEKDNDKGTLQLSITDAPMDTSEIAGVYITITDIQYHISGNNFSSFEDFEGPKEFNLLDLTRGATELLGNLEMDPGTYTQIRFILDAPEFGMGTPSSPGCYLEFKDGTTEQLFVPSGSQTGFKGVGAFTVPANGVVDVTADFDVRKSVVHSGTSGMFILKPTIRLVVNNQAGKIVGGVTNIPDGNDIVVYAYEEGVYSEEEASEPEVETPRFPNAVSSDIVDDSGNYHIDFLAPKTYDLVVVALQDSEFYQVLGIVEGVVVESRETTTQSIDVDNL
ncbi:MAG: DUF4382 domain-containing protein [Bacteroidales bacterium]